MDKYKVIALYGKGGSGKNYIFNEIMKFKEFDFHKVIGSTTRPPREGEKDGVDYHFIEPRTFADKVLNLEMVEAASFRGWCYGTDIKDFNINKINVGIFNDVALDILLQDERFDIIPIYINARSKVRLIRMLNREEEPDINEVFRRYQADEKDYKNFFVEQHPELPEIIYDNNNPLDLNKLKAFITSLCDQFEFWQK